MAAVIERLLHSEEPAVRYRAALLADGSASDLTVFHEAMRTSPCVGALLAGRNDDGAFPWHPYSKWHGANWVLPALADLGYPPGDTSLAPLRDQSYAWLLSDKHLRNVRAIAGRVRRCACQEGSALYATLALGIADERSEQLVANLVRWQWPDGGWNCDKRAEAVNSSFMETLIPLRALALHAQATGSPQSRMAVERAAEVFLKRRLFQRVSDGSVINQHFLRLHYPCYWHYDILYGLKVLAEAGFITDSRRGPALDVLESKRLPDGGWPAEERYYRVSEKLATGVSPYDWGGTSVRRMNEWVTLDALYVLKSAGRV